MFSAFYTKINIAYVNFFITFFLAIFLLVETSVSNFEITAYVFATTLITFGVNVSDVTTRVINFVVEFLVMPSTRTVNNNIS